MNRRSVWNRAGRRSGGSRPEKIIVPPLTRGDLEIIRQREAVRKEFGEASVKRFDEMLERKARES